MLQSLKMMKKKKKNTNGENYRINTTNVDLTFSRRSQDIVDVSRV